MKIILRPFISLLMLALVLVSCEEDALDSLNGKYTHPDVCNYTVIDSEVREKVGTLFEFTINLKGEGSNTLNLKLYSANYALPTSDYRQSETVAPNTYLIGAGGSTCNGQQIIGNTISIRANGPDYDVEGILHLADGTVVRMTASFSIVYEYVPMYTYSVELETPAMGGAQGDVAIAGATKHKLSIFADGVMTSYLEVIADDAATDLSGSYVVKAAPDAAGQMSNGYYLDYSWWGGAGVLDGGSYYLANDEKQYLREGGDAITIVDQDGVLTITADNLAVLDVEALVASGGQDWAIKETPGSVNFSDSKEALVNPVSAIAYTDGTAYSTYLILSTAGITSTYYPDYYAWGHAGNGNVVSLQMYGMGDATLAPGTYNIVSNAPSVGDIVAGYVHPEYFYNAGSVLSTVVDDVSTEVLIKSGTVEVIADGDNYIMILDVITDNGSYQTTYSGPLSVTVY